MKRRSLVALVAAGVLVFLGLLAVSAVLFVTRTYRGREYVRSFAQPLIARAIKGNLYLGHLGGSFLNQLTIDSVAIRDERGELFVSTGPITLDYNPRDILDARAFIRRATIEHPYVHVVQHNDYSWNFKRIFAGSPSPPKTKDVNTRGWGSYVVADSVRLHDATFLVTLRWQPDDSLKGARRDSVIRVTLANPARAVTPTYDGYGRLYAWRNINGLISHARLFDPDSDQKYGREFKVATLSADEFEPTFKFRNVVADVRLQGDSVWFQSPHFELPSSNGRGAGKVWWGSDLPVRYDIIVHGTSVALEDVNWAYPPLPTTGGGSVDLAIRNDPTNIQIVDFRLSNMDVKTTGSHVTGTMSFGIGAPVLLVRNVDLKGDPVDFDFVRYINQKPFPVDWRGQLYGNVKGRGGPLTHFVVDQSDVTFHDAHVPGATSHATGKGELDILFPAFTAFHHFDVNATSVDLRSIEYLYPAFPRLGGTVSGTATLDSSWLDVRFSNADVYHQDGPGEPSHLTGSGRITYGDPFMTYDVTLDARPLSLTMLSRSYPNPLRGLMSGPVQGAGAVSRPRADDDAHRRRRHVQLRRAGRSRLGRRTRRARTRTIQRAEPNDAARESRRSARRVQRSLRSRRQRKERERGQRHGGRRDRAHDVRRRHDLSVAGARDIRRRAHARRHADARDERGNVGSERSDRSPEGAQRLALVQVHARFSRRPAPLSIERRLEHGAGFVVGRDQRQEASPRDVSTRCASRARLREPSSTSRGTRAVRSRSGSTS